LLDVVLPDFDGFEVSRQLREQDATRDIPIIFLSAMNDPADQIKGFEAGCVDYITKPFDPQTILLRVRAHVSRHGTGLSQMAEIGEQVRGEERKRISREIHDELGQLLSALRMQISGISTQKDKAAEVVPSDRLDFMSTLIARAQTATKDIVAGLRSPEFDLDLVPALKWQVEEFIKNTDVPCQLNVSSEVVNLEYGHTLALVRIVQEALTNVMRYAHATEVEVRLSYLESHLILAVRDNGVGFDQEEVKDNEQSFGLAGIQERADMLGGVLRVTSRLDHGTIVNVIIPV